MLSEWRSLKTRSCFGRARGGWRPRREIGCVAGGHVPTSERSEAHRGARRGTRRPPPRRRLPRRARTPAQRLEGGGGRAAVGAAAVGARAPHLRRRAPGTPRVTKETLPNKNPANALTPTAAPAPRSSPTPAGRPPRCGLVGGRHRRAALQILAGGRVGVGRGDGVQRRERVGGDASPSPRSARSPRWRCGRAAGSRGSHRCTSCPGGARRRARRPRRRLAPLRSNVVATCAAKRRTS